jgi:hypothetical protein
VGDRRYQIHPWSVGSFETDPEALRQGIPLAAGILLTIVSFIFIIELGSIDFEEDGFWGFVFFGLVGIPSIFVGLGILCR